MADPLLQFNQVLHGYRDGHTLLAASLDLPSEVKRIMLPISDMSGSRMLRGFEEYITGYPLKHINCYALAKTWYAPEMKRPGCVWTHTILIDFENVPKLTDVLSLIKLFKRPSDIEPNFKNYDNKIFLKPGIAMPGEERFRSRNKENIIDNLIFNLYEFNSYPVVLQFLESDLFDEMFLKVWMQQWPRLKRSFSFCTGAISPRTFMGKLLDLQVVPPQYLDSATTSNVKLVDLDQGNFSIDSNYSWVKIASNALDKNEEDLRLFFNLFGSDVQGDRSAFKPLVKAYQLLVYEKPNVDECIITIAGLFENFSEAATLKNYLFGRKRKIKERNLPTYDERALIYHLSITENDKSFDYKKLDFERRFVEQFSALDDADIEVLKQILKIGPNIFGENAVTKLAESISANNILDLLWADKQLSLIFIILNPSLAYNQSFWEVNRSNHLEIAHSLLQSASISHFNWERIIKILIDHRSSIDVDELNLEESFLVECILNTINDNYTTSLPDNWLRYLKSKERSVLSWLTSVDVLEEQAVNILVNILNPNSPLLSKVGPEKWVMYLQNHSRFQLNLIASDVHAFFVALALNSKNPEFNKLYTYSFEIVYYALAQESLNHNSWRRIEIHTKPLGFFKDWDRCKKLINAVVDHFIENGWPINYIINHLQSSEIRDRLSTRFRKKSK